jgi:hypothetical protein
MGRLEVGVFPRERPAVITVTNPREVCGPDALIDLDGLDARVSKASASAMAPSRQVQGLSGGSIESSASTRM